MLIDQQGAVLAWFSLMLDEQQVQQFIQGDAQVVIGELETLAPTIAMDLWAELCKSRHIVFYIDNDGARYSLIKGYSSSVSLSLLSRMLAVRLEELVCIQWFARVASASNLADFPSRNMEHPMLPHITMADLHFTLEVFNKGVDEFLGDHSRKVGLGQVANKNSTTRSISNARRKRKLVS